MNNTNTGFTSLLASQLEEKNEGLALLLTLLASDSPEEAGQIVENNLDWLSSKEFILGESETGFSCKVAEGVDLEFTYDLIGLNNLVKYEDQPNKLLVLSNFDADVQQELAGLLSHYADVDISVGKHSFTLRYEEKSAEIKFGARMKDVSNIISEELRYHRGHEEFCKPESLSQSVPA